LKSTDNNGAPGVLARMPTREVALSNVVSMRVSRKGLRLEIMNKRTMQITLELPEDIAQGMESKWKDLPRAALESLALEAYRSRAITAAQLRRLLGFETRMQVDTFLKEHEVYDFTAADFEQDRETLRQLRVKEGQR
jgi:hypothetical protein